METHAWQQLRTLRDELRLEMHLAGMELREQWQVLEPKVQEAERTALALGENGRWLVEELLTHVRALRAEVREHFGTQRRPDA